MKPFLSIPIAIVLCSAPAWAQNPLSVHIVDANGTPIVGAQVVVEVWFVGAAPVAPQTTDATGNAQFSIPNLPDVSSPMLTVVAGAKGYAFGGTMASPGKVELRLERGASWRGSVVDEAGKPLSDATIALESAVRDRDFRNMVTLPRASSPLSSLYTAKSGADGSFVIENVPADQELFFWAQGEGMSRVQGHDAFAGTDQKIKLVRAGTLHGKVLGPDGKPVAKLLVSASGGRGAGGNTATTDAQGNFIISNLAPGTYAVGARTTNGAAYLLSDQHGIRVIAGETAELGEWKAQRGVVIRGTVRDAATQKPLANAWLYARSTQTSAQPSSVSASSDASGNFALRVLPGTYQLRFSGATPGYLRPNDAPQVKVDANGKQDIELALALKKAPVIQGVTLDEQGHPIKAQFTVNRGDEEVTSDAKGHWQFTPTEPNDLGFGGGVDDTGYFEVVGPQKVEWPITKSIAITVRHKPWDSVSGRVVTPEGAPVAGGRVQGEYLVRIDDSTRTTVSASATTDADGRYVLAKMRGTYELKISGVKAGFEFKNGGDVSRQGDAVGVSDLVMVSLGGQIEGTTGPGATVVVDGRETRADGNGHFAFADIPAGQHTAFAALGDSFGTATGDTNLAIKLQQLPPQAQNQALAEQIWAAIKDKGGDALSLQDWLTPPSPEEAMKAAVAAGDQLRISQAGARWKAGDSLELLQSGLALITQSSFRDDLLLQAALSTKDPALTKSALTNFKAAPIDANWHERHLYMSAVLRERLNGADDGKLALSEALAYTLQNHPEKSRVEGARQTQVGRNEALQNAASIVAQGSPTLLRELLDSIDEGSGFKVGALSEAIPAIVKAHGLEAAQPLLNELETMPKPTVEAEPGYAIFDPQWAYGQTVNAIIPLIGQGSPAKALELAQKVNTTAQGSDFRAQALASAAKFQPLEIAAPLYREAIKISSSYDTPRLAALAWNRDPQLGTELFAIARQKTEDDANNPLHSYYNPWTLFAFYYARVSPAQSRLILEREWAKSLRDKVDSDRLTAIAIAMTPSDAGRAQQLVNQLPTEGRAAWAEAEARRKIARYLFADEATQRTFTHLAPPATENTDAVQW